MAAATVSTAAYLTLPPGSHLYHDSQKRSETKRVPQSRAHHSRGSHQSMSAVSSSCVRLDESNNTLWIAPTLHAFRRLDQSSPPHVVDLLDAAASREGVGARGSSTMHRVQVDTAAFAPDGSSSLLLQQVAPLVYDVVYQSREALIHAVHLQEQDEEDGNDDSYPPSRRRHPEQYAGHSATVVLYGPMTAAEDRALLWERTGAFAAEALSREIRSLRQQEREEVRRSEKGMKHVGVLPSLRNDVRGSSSSSSSFLRPAANDSEQFSSPPHRRSFRLTFSLSDHYSKWGVADVLDTNASLIYDPAGLHELRRRVSHAHAQRQPCHLLEPLVELELAPEDNVEEQEEEEEHNTRQSRSDRKKRKPDGYRFFQGPNHPQPTTAASKVMRAQSREYDDLEERQERERGEDEDEDEEESFQEVEGVNRDDADAALRHDRQRSRIQQDGARVLEALRRCGRGGDDAPRCAFRALYTRAEQEQHRKESSSVLTFTLRFSEYIKTRNDIETEVSVTSQLHIVWLPFSDQAAPKNRIGRELSAMVQMIQTIVNPTTQPQVSTTMTPQRNNNESNRSIQLLHPSHYTNLKHPTNHSSGFPDVSSISNTTTTHATASATHAAVVPIRDSPVLRHLALLHQEQQQVLHRIPPSALASAQLTWGGDRDTSSALFSAARNNNASTAVSSPLRGRSAQQRTRPHLYTRSPGHSDAASLLVETARVSLDGSLAVLGSQVCFIACMDVSMESYSQVASIGQSLALMRRPLSSSSSSSVLLFQKERTRQGPRTSQGSESHHHYDDESAEWGGGGGHPQHHDPYSYEKPAGGVAMINEAEKKRRLMQRETKRRLDAMTMDPQDSARLQRSTAAGAPHRATPGDPLHSYPAQGNVQQNVDAATSLVVYEPAEDALRYDDGGVLSREQQHRLRRYRSSSSSRAAAEEQEDGMYPNQFRLLDTKDDHKNRFADDFRNRLDQDADENGLYAATTDRRATGSLHRRQDAMISEGPSLISAISAASSASGAGAAAAATGGDLRFDETPTDEKELDETSDDGETSVERQFRLRYQQQDERRFPVSMNHPDDIIINVSPTAKHAMLRDDDDDEEDREVQQPQQNRQLPRPSSSSYPASITSPSSSPNRSARTVKFVTEERNLDHKRNNNNTRVTGAAGDDHAFHEKVLFTHANRQQQQQQQQQRRQVQESAAVPLIEAEVEGKKDRRRHHLMKDSTPTEMVHERYSRTTTTTTATSTISEQSSLPNVVFARQNDSPTDQATAAAMRGEVFSGNHHELIRVREEEVEEQRSVGKGGNRAADYEGEFDIMELVPNFDDDDVDIDVFGDEGGGDGVPNKESNGAAGKPFLDDEELLRFEYERAMHALYADHLLSSEDDQQSGAANSAVGSAEHGTDASRITKARQVEVSPSPAALKALSNSSSSPHTTRQTAFPTRQEEEEAEHVDQKLESKAQQRQVSPSPPPPLADNSAHAVELSAVTEVGEEEEDRGLPAALVHKNGTDRRRATMDDAALVQSEERSNRSHRSNNDDDGLTHSSSPPAFHSNESRAAVMIANENARRKVAATAEFPSRTSQADPISSLRPSNDHKEGDEEDDFHRSYAIGRTSMQQLLHMERSEHQKTVAFLRDALTNAMTSSAKWEMEAKSRIAERALDDAVDNDDGQEDQNPDDEGEDQAWNQPPLAASSRPEEKALLSKLKTTPTMTTGLRQAALSLSPDERSAARSPSTALRRRDDEEEDDGDKKMRVPPPPPAPFMAAAPTSPRYSDILPVDTVTPRLQSATSLAASGRGGVVTATTLQRVRPAALPLPEAQQKISTAAALSPSSKALPPVGIAQRTNPTGVRLQPAKANLAPVNNNNRNNVAEENGEEDESAEGPEVLSSTAASFAFAPRYCHPQQPATNSSTNNPDSRLTQLPGSASSTIAISSSSSTDHHNNGSKMQRTSKIASSTSMTRSTAAVSVVNHPPPSSSARVEEKGTAVEWERLYEIEKQRRLQFEREAATLRVSLQSLQRESSAIAAAAVEEVEQVIEEVETQVTRVREERMRRLQIRAALLQSELSGDASRQRAAFEASSLLLSFSGASLPAPTSATTSLHLSPVKYTSSTDPHPQQHQDQLFLPAALRAGYHRAQQHQQEQQASTAQRLTSGPHRASPSTSPSRGAATSGYEVPEGEEEEDCSLVVKLVAASVGSRSPSASAASLTPQALNTLVRLPPPAHDLSFHDREQLAPRDWLMPSGGPETLRNNDRQGGATTKFLATQPRNASLSSTAAFADRTTTEVHVAEQRTTSRTKQHMDTPPSSSFLPPSSTSVYANTIAYEAYYGRPQPQPQLQEPKNNTSYHQSQNVVALADTMAYEYDRGLFRDLAF